MFKLVTLACLLAVAYGDFQNVDFGNCDSDSSRFGQITMLQIDANPVEIQKTTLHVNADITIMQDMTDPVNQANLDAAVVSIDAEVKMGWFSDHVCKGGNFLLNDHKCVLPFCATVGQEYCDQAKTKKVGDVFSLRNIAFGPLTDLGWIGSVLSGSVTVVDVQASIESPDYQSTFACAEIKGVTIDLGN